MKRLRLDLEYDGADFAGWARQPECRTVEAVLRDALDRVFPDWSELAVAGRTDAGVHARGQVVSVDVEGGPPAEHVAEALNRKMPPDVAVRESCEAPAGFNARFSAVARAYVYRIANTRARPALDRRALWYPQPIDVPKLKTAAAAIVGHHDFRAFTPTETEHDTFGRDVVAASWVGEPGGFMEFTIVADSFLRHMVRTLVGTMLQLEPVEIVRLLNGASREHAGRTVSPEGLILLAVAYTPAEVGGLSSIRASD